MRAYLLSELNRLSSKIYFSVDNIQHGPVAVSIVQRMIRDGELPSDCFVWRQGMSDWQPVSAVLARLASKDQKDGLRALGLAIRRGLTADEADNELAKITAEDPEKARLWNDWSIRRTKKNEVIAYCASQKPPIRISTFFLEEILEEEQAKNSSVFSETEPRTFVDLLNERHPIHTWRDDPATDPQLRLLASHRVTVRSDLTKGEASDMIEALINGVTEGQKRRLAFYGLDPTGLSKDEATEIIDEYIAAHPDAEYGYQVWKTQEIRKEPPSGMTAKQWDEALDWARKQSTTAKFSLPDPIPGDEPASSKQIVYIRSLVEEIDESTLRTLTKGQARSLIDEILAKKKAFSKAIAEEYVHTHPRPQSVVFLWILIALGVLGVIIFALLSR